jgi:putative SOS response-associated peptidase YedK
VPFFTKLLSDVKGISTINAKAETVETSPTFRTPFKKRRCLVPADGYYEWARLDEKTKQPYAFRMKNDAPFAFAGLWDAWKAPDGSWLQSFSILTTDANRPLRHSCQLLLSTAKALLPSRRAPRVTVAPATAPEASWRPRPYI